MTQKKETDNRGTIIRAIDRILEQANLQQLKIVYQYVIHLKR